MEMGEDDRKKVELIHVALQQLMDERKKNKGKERAEEEEDSLLISRLLSQLTNLENDVSTTHVPNDSSNRVEPSSSTSESKDCGTKEVGIEEVVKELQRVKRQNLITHCLLSVMIITTAFWKFNEVSLLLTLREKLSHPLRAVGEIIKGSLKGRQKKLQIEASPIPPVGVPVLPHVNLPTLTFSNNNEE